MTIILTVLASAYGSWSCPGGVPRDQSLNYWPGEFLVGGVEKKTSPVPRPQSTGKIDRPSYQLTGPYMRAEHGVWGVSWTG